MVWFINFHSFSPLLFLFLCFLLLGCVLACLFFGCFSFLPFVYFALHGIISHGLSKIKKLISLRGFFFFFLLIVNRALLFLSHGNCITSLFSLLLLLLLLPPLFFRTCKSNLTFSFPHFFFFILLFCYT